MSGKKYQSCLFFFSCTVFFAIASLFLWWKFSGRSATSGAGQVLLESSCVQPDAFWGDQSIGPAQVGEKPSIVAPISGALSRVTKKPFGIYITPKNSPVQPERFQGYHTGVDFEVTPDEQIADVPVVALCDGTLLMARPASGYGGVAVQSCTLGEQTVTVIYGHISLASMRVTPGSELQVGDFLANLGVGFSRETDGERKHLHLGIHKGDGVNIFGYVQRKGDLASWIDPATILSYFSL